MKQNTKGHCILNMMDFDENSLFIGKILFIFI